MTGDGNTLWIWQVWGTDDSWHVIEETRPLISRSEHAAREHYGEPADLHRRLTGRPIRLAKFEQVAQLQTETGVH